MFQLHPVTLLALVILMTNGVESDTTTASPSTDKCDAAKFCCCGKMTGKMCLKNNNSGTLLKGNCDNSDGNGNALYECETSDYPAKFLKICGGVKGCESILPGHFGADFCEDF